MNYALLMIFFLLLQHLFHKLQVYILWILMDTVDGTSSLSSCNLSLQSVVSEEVGVSSLRGLDSWNNTSGIYCLTESMCKAVHLNYLARSASLAWWLLRIFTLLLFEQHKVIGSGQHSRICGARPSNASKNMFKIITVNIVENELMLNVISKLSPSIILSKA